MRRTRAASRIREATGPVARCLRIAPRSAANQASKGNTYIAAALMLYVTSANNNACTETSTSRPLMRLPILVRGARAPQISHVCACSWLRWYLHMWHTHSPGRLLKVTARDASKAAELPSSGCGGGISPHSALVPVLTFKKLGREAAPIVIVAWKRGRAP